MSTASVSRTKLEMTHMAHVVKRLEVTLVIDTSICREVWKDLNRALPLALRTRSEAPCTQTELEISERWTKKIIISSSK